MAVFVAVLAATAAAALGGPVALCCPASDGGAGPGLALQDSSYKLCSACTLRPKCSVYFCEPLQYQYACSVVFCLNSISGVAAGNKRKNQL